MNDRKSDVSMKLRAGMCVGTVVKRVVGKNTVLPVLGGPLKGKKWVAGAGIEQIFGWPKERYTDRFAASVTPSSVVYDVGAQVGWYTVLSSSLVEPGGTVIAFEPLPAVVRYLRRNVEVNNCTNVQIVEAAVSDNDGSARFFVAERGSLGSLSSGYGPTATTVKTVTIDSLVQDKTIPPPDFIKMDIERGELAALKGAKSTLVEHAPMIFLETHGPDMCTGCCDLLDSFGYVWERIERSCSLVARRQTTPGIDRDES